MTTRYLLTRPAGAGPVLVRHDDAAALPVLFHRGYTPPVEVRCIESGGRLYALHHDCPDEGLDVLDVAAVEAKEAALDAEVAKLSPDARAWLGHADWEPHHVRKAKRAADDAEAEVRALEARGVKGAELAQAKADAEAKRAAVDEAKAGRGKP